MAPVSVKGYRYVKHERIHRFTRTGAEVVQADPEFPTYALDAQPVRLRTGKANIKGYWFVRYYETAADAATSMNGPRYLIGRED